MTTSKWSENNVINESESPFQEIDEFLLEVEEIPCKAQYPKPPKPLNMLNKDKYGLQEYNFSGKLTTVEKEEAYKKYYEVKFKELCTKQANGIYEDFLSRVNSAYEKKKNSHLNNRSQYANYD